jgi:hypothetical protein
MHPEAYLGVSLVEAEQMQFDDDYQCDLPLSDLQRIEKLPPQVGKAFKGLLMFRFVRSLYAAWAQIFYSISIISIIFIITTPRPPPPPPPPTTTTTTNR